MIAIGDPRTFGEQALDMSVIEGVAAITGGQAFQALSSVELTRVYDEIAKLEPSQFASFSYQPKVSVHYVPIAFGISMYFMLYSVVMLNSHYSGRRHLSRSKRQAQADATANHKVER